MSIPNWWGDWRPGLTPHTGNLQSTDLIECTQIVGGQPVNTAITGQQIINAASGGSPAWGSITGTLSAQTDLQTALNGKQATLVSGSNIKTVNGSSILGSGNLTVTGGGPQILGYSGTIGTSTTGTSITISKSLLIPANTLTTDSLLEMSWRMIRVSGNLGQIYSRLYINQTNTLTGANLISGIITMNGGGTQQALLSEKSISCIGTQLRYQNTAVGTESTASSLSTLSINTALNYYLIYTVQCQNSGDVAAVDQFRVLLYA